MARVSAIPRDARSGVWTVTTRTSTYLVDLDEKTLLRAPGVGRSDEETWEVAELRKDSQDIPLLSIRSCAVGEPAQFWVQSVDDPQIRTWRVTTPVVEIERID